MLVTQTEEADFDRRRQAGMTGNRGRHIDHEPEGPADTGAGLPAERFSALDPLGQRQRVHRALSRRLAQGKHDRAAIHCPRKTVAKRQMREFQWQAAGRMPEPRMVHFAA